MTTPAPSFVAISRVVFQPLSVRITVSVFCFKSAISASCFPGLTFSRLIKITDSSDMAYLLLFRTHQGRPEGWKRIATWKIFWKIISKERPLPSLQRPLQRPNAARVHCARAPLRRYGACPGRGMGDGSEPLGSLARTGTATSCSPRRNCSRRAGARFGRAALHDRCTTRHGRRETRARRLTRCASSGAAIDLLQHLGEFGGYEISLRHE